MATPDEQALSEAHGRGYDEGYNEARADLLSKLRAKLARRELTSVKAVAAWVQNRIEKTQRAGNWPEGW